MNINSIWNSVYPVILAILFFEVIIIVHEGGHFIAAKLMKIKVNEFSIGMGPKVFSFTKGDTKYSLRWVPFGGYCAMEGEDKNSDDENSFSNKRPLARMFVVCAGAFMNLLLGFIIIVCIICSQETVGTTTVSEFVDNAPSHISGLQVGDTIKSIDGLRVYTVTDLSTALSRSTDDIVSMVVKRDNEDVNLEITFNTEEYEGTNYILLDFYTKGLDKTFTNVTKNAFCVFASYSKMVFLSLHDIIVGKYGVSDLSGPVGVVSAVSSAAKVSLRTFFKMAVLITINIGLFNLFPIPALDGWRFFVLLGEAILKRKLPQKLEYGINAIGLCLLLSLMVFVTFSDITKLF